VSSPNSISPNVHVICVVKAFATCSDGRFVELPERVIKLASLTNLDIASRECRRLVPEPVTDPPALPIRVCPPKRAIKFEPERFNRCT
jgi:hypothetical protein